MILENFWKVPFYEEELQKEIKGDDIFRIKNILRKKKRGRDNVSAGKMERVPRKVQ